LSTFEPIIIFLSGFEFHSKS